MAVCGLLKESFTVTQHLELTAKAALLKLCD